MMESLARRVDAALADAQIQVRIGERLLPNGLPLEHGGKIAPCKVAYEMVGAAGAPVVAVLGGISGHRHVGSHAYDPRPGWWENQSGQDHAFDPRRLRTLAIDWVHAPGMAVTPADQASALVAVLDVLGVHRLDAVVGASYGGMVALALAARHPGRLNSAMIIGAAHESHPMAEAVRGVQRKIVEMGLRTGEPYEAMVLARSLAMTTYRSDIDYRNRFSGPPTIEGGKARFPIEDYLEYNGRKFADRVSPEAFLCLCQSLDIHRIDPAEVGVPVTLVSIDTDSIAPPWQVQQLNEGLKVDSEVIHVGSPNGHDAFLTEAETFGRILSDYLEDLA
jgi:homoserine O-acetyltransferase